ncbi:MAG: YgfZ/GcvT domain-containing protein [Methyloceanibacter sp.]|uniref:CAF17-like 4Fe-4S cluster assembly/insertion protein YgfZ n=1 Tax=Methyloceanibacter sp. TaxID=1965321 RepID=UPI003D6D10EB
MSHCHATLLSDRGVVRVAGADAAKLLQGVITTDIDKAHGRAAIHAGLLTPQGKILFDFFVVAADGGFLLEVARDKAAELVKRLGFYRLRAEVEIAEEPAFKVAAAWGGEPNLPAGAISFADPRLPELGLRILLPEGAGVAQLGCMEAEGADYHVKRIKLGVPEGGRDYAFGDAYPHDALFDQLNGVDFHKGCFVGQEVVSRMQHKSTTRKRIVPVEGDAPLPPSGTEVVAGDLPLGPLGSVSGASGLALLRLDRAEEALARGTPLTAGAVKITLRRPAFAGFDVPVAISA